MSENSVQPIGRLRAPESSSAREDLVLSAHRSSKPVEGRKEQPKYLSNIAIHFNVDDETNNLVVVVTDRESGRVLRTIPASEFEKVQAGDLLKLTA